MGAEPGSNRNLVDVVVVTYKPGSTIGDFLASVAASGEVVATVTVVDSDSQDGVAEEAARDASARFVAMSSNRGYGAAANAGSSHGEAPVIAVCNADLVLDAAALRMLAEELLADPSVGAVGPRILEEDGTVYPSARPLPSFWLGAGHGVFGRVWPGNPWTRRYRVALDPDAPIVNVGWLSGSCLVVRRDLFERLGGFDEGFFMFMEDVDLGRRIGLAGFRSRWVPEAVATHLGGHSWRRDPEPMIRVHHESAARYVGLAFPGWWRAPLRAVVRAGLRARTRAEVAAATRTGAH